MKNEWNLKSQYKNVNDPALERDVMKTERAYAQFERQYKKNTTYLSNPTALKKALKDFENLYILPKPLSYLFLLKAIQTNNKKIDAKIALVQQRIVRSANKVVFFELSLGKISKEQQQFFLSNRTLRDYHYFLKRTFARGSHELSEKENQLLAELSLPSSEMWMDLTERLQNERSVRFENADIPVSAASGLLSKLNKKDRNTLWSQIRAEFKADASIAEAELNALYTTKSVLDRKRGFSEPYDETLLDFENTQKELNALRSAVHNHIQISHDFYAYKRDVLRLKTMTYADRNVDRDTFTSEFSFARSKEIINAVFEKSHSTFRPLLDEMLKSQRIDVYPRLGKTAGAFCSGNIEFPTYVLLNHVNTLDSLSTFIHEVGHAIHTELSKRNIPLYQGYSTSTAEFASTFFEELLFIHLMPLLSKKEQKLLLHNRINRDVSTIFRQMAFFEFELALHRKVREQGYVPKEYIAELLNQKTGEYMGDAVKLEHDDGYFFVALSHIRRHFYVYSYAYGGLLSRLAIKQSTETPEMLDDVVRLLSGGSAEAPKDLFKRIGINTESTKTYYSAFSVIRDDFERLKKM
jgi:oligoendopeptidase F